MSKKKRFKERSPRMQKWNYSAPGFYFITTCTKDKEPIFGKIMGNKLIGNEFTDVIQHHWNEVNQYHDRVRTDEFIIMPDHLHFIIELTHDEFKWKLNTYQNCHEFADPSNLPTSWVTNPWSKNRRQMLIPKIVGKFKMQTAKQVNLLRGTPGTPVWQPNYHCRVVMEHEILPGIRKYIRDNPKISPI